MTKSYARWGDLRLEFEDKGYLPHVSVTARAVQSRDLTPFIPYDMLEDCHIAVEELEGRLFKATCFEYPQLFWFSDDSRDEAAYGLYKELVALLLLWNANMESNRQDRTAMKRSAAASRRRFESDRALAEFIAELDDGAAGGEAVGA